MEMEMEMEQHLGKTVKKKFEGPEGVFRGGVVKSYDSSSQFYRIDYEDGDSEELNLSQLTSLLLLSSEEEKAELNKPRLGRKPKKKRRRKSDPIEELGNFNDQYSNSNSIEEIKKVRVFESTNNCNSMLNHSCLKGTSEEDNLDDLRNVNLSNFCGEAQEIMNDRRVGETESCRKTISVGSGVNSGFDLNVSTIEEENDLSARNFIDLNLDANGDDLDDTSTKVIDLNLGTRVKAFDLNLGCDDESPGNEEICGGSNISEINKVLEDGFVDGGRQGEAAVCDDGKSKMGTTEDNLAGGFDAEYCNEGFESPGVQLKTEEGIAQNGPFVNNENLDNSGGTHKRGTRGRKRKKVSDNLESPMSEPPPRRITRRSAATFYAQNHDSNTITTFHAMGDISSKNDVPNALTLTLTGVDDLSSSPIIIKELSEQEIIISGCGGHEELDLSPCKLQLPPSSQSLNLDGLPGLDVFSVYSCLRSFSALLFLSPFELEDFVAALKCKSPSSLLDFIHVSVLQTLRKHLEYLSGEGSQSASDCLRCLNWNFLDSITWPVFMVEYILIHGSGLRSDFDLSRLKLFESDYYKQPASVKVELLRCLCDDVIEAEAIRSELNRRSLIAGSDMNFDQNVKVAIRKKRKVDMDVPDGSCLADEVVDETIDWNSDECCLCKMDGSLICCDGCPAAYHSRCVGVASELLPEGEWYCPECIISKSKPWMKQQKALRGAELLGADPHGQLYFSSYGCLLVLDSSNNESDFKYYHRDDLDSVIEVLKSSGIRYGPLLNAISQHWHVPIYHEGEGNSNITSAVCNMTIEDPITISESADGIQQARTHIQDSHECKLDFLNGSVELSTANQFVNQSVPSPRSAAVNKKKGNMSQVDSGPAYMNYYSFAQITSFIAEELLPGFPDKSSEEPTKSIEEIISIQLKAILKKSTRFYWPAILNVNVDAQREKCGWCICCRFPDDDKDCLFMINNAGPAEEKFQSEMTSFPKRHRKDHLSDVICQILSMESRLYGLLLGPWLNPHYSKQWRKSVMKASDVAAVRHALLTLELHLCHLALSADWLKHVDSDVTMGSASHVLTSSVCMSTKNTISRKKGRNSELESGPCSNAETGLSLLWWRGGRLSRHLFNWKVLPRSLSQKAARQAGCTKILGILYSDGSEFAKRSKYIAWRAAVETTTSIQQLAFLVRELDSSIKWDDIENRHPLSLVDKGLQKSIRAFKKVIVRRKCIEGAAVKYLLDFGKRRIIPDIVVKYGSVLDESTSGRKRYLLEESYIPLHLLKSFEEKRIARKANNVNSVKLLDGRRMKKQRCRSKGFSYLFSRAERSENYQCGHCRKDVLIREAVSCQYCEGFFHKRHVRRSPGTFTAGCTYACHKCQEGKRINIQTKKGKGKSHKSKKVSTNSKLVQTKKSKKASKHPRLLKTQNKKAVLTNVPLRRSPRKIKYAPVQNQRRGRRKKSRQVKSKTRISRKQKESVSWKKKRMPMHHSYWLNGLQLSKKPDDERVMQFRKKHLLLSCENIHVNGIEAKCNLCCEAGYTSTLNYIGCEICQDWFHWDAFGFDMERIGNTIGFRCHACRQRTPPICPHLQDGKINGVESFVAKISAGVECSEELSNAPVRPTKVYVRMKQKSHSDGDSQSSFQIDECNNQEQQSVILCGPNQSLAPEANSEGDNGHLPVSNTDLKREKLAQSNETINTEESAIV